MQELPNIYPAYYGHQAAPSPPPPLFDVTFDLLYVVVVFHFILDEAAAIFFSFVTLP